MTEVVGDTPGVKLCSLNGTGDADVFVTLPSAINHLAAGLGKGQIVVTTAAASGLESLSGTLYR